MADYLQVFLTINNSVDFLLWKIALIELGTKNYDMADYLMIYKFSDSYVDFWLSVGSHISPHVRHRW